MSRHKFMKDLTEDAIGDLDYDDDYEEYDYYGNEDPDIIGKKK